MLFSFSITKIQQKSETTKFFFTFFSGFQILVNRIRKGLFSHFLVEVINTVSETVMPVLIWVHMILALLFSPGETGEDEYQDVETQIDRTQNDAGEREQEASSHAFSATTLKWTQQDVDQEKTDSDNEVDVHMLMSFNETKSFLDFSLEFFKVLLGHSDFGKPETERHWVLLIPSLIVDVLAVFHYLYCS